jgi:hypothetical protein
MTRRDFDPLYDDGIPEPIYNYPVNPKQYEMLDLIQTNTAFNNPNASRFGPIYDEIGQCRDLASQQYQNQVMGHSDYMMIDNLMQNSQVQTGLFQQHTDDHLSNLQYNLPSAQQAIYIGNNMPNPISNFCSVINGLFDSFFYGQNLLDAFLFCIRSLKSHITRLNFVGILNEVQCLGGFLADLARLILKELGYLSYLLGLLRNWANASLFLGLGNDPCVRLLFRAIGSTALVRTLGPLTSGAGGITLGGTFGNVIPRVPVPGGFTL